MRTAWVRAAVLGGAIFAAAAAHAQSTPTVMLVANNFASVPASPSNITTGHTLEWDARKGRWGLRLGVEQRTDNLAEWRDVQPGVYYKVTPRLHIGGAISLAPNPMINQRIVEPPATAPRVRLETTFKF